MGLAFADPSHGSDAGIIRSLDGKFHVIYEDWSPINASKRSWDSPIGGHAIYDRHLASILVQWKVVGVEHD